MSSIYCDENGEYQVKMGSNIRDTIIEGIVLSVEKKCSIEFEHNGITVSVGPDSDPRLIYRDWSRALKGYIGKNVGPNPNLVLTDKELANDARIKANTERKSKKRQAEHNKKAKAHRKAVETKLVNAPGIELADEAGWQEFKKANSDWYGDAVVTYSERWARLMQIEMANGKTLEQVASATSDEANLENISGAMYSAAVSTLARIWKQGEQLRLWHNLDTQRG